MQRDKDAIVPAIYAVGPLQDCAKRPKLMKLFRLVIERMPGSGFVRVRLGTIDRVRKRYITIMEPGCLSNESKGWSKEPGRSTKAIMLTCLTATHPFAPARVGNSPTTTGLRVIFVCKASVRRPKHYNQTSLRDPRISPLPMPSEMNSSEIGRRRDRDRQS